MRLMLCVFLLLALAGSAFAQSESKPPPRLADAQINVTIDQVVSWLAVGVLVAWMVTALGAIGSKKVKPGISLILGLVGATAGGFAVSALQLNWNLGAIVISYETLIMALAGALILVLVPAFLFRSRKGK